MFVTLNEEGKKKWGDIFPLGTVPVLGLTFRYTMVGAYYSSEEVVLVNWKVLLQKQKDSIIDRIKKQSGGQEEEILTQIATKGLPLLKRYTTGVVCEQLRYFI